MFYTGKGDDGTSNTLNSAGRGRKDDPIFQALGTLDELNALIGLCFAKVHSTGGDDNTVPVSVILRQLQEDLFIAQAELAGAQKRLMHRHLEYLEETIAEISKHIENPHAFVIAGANELSAYLDLARTVSRRAERSVLAAEGTTALSSDTKAYLNRLSSVLYVLARYAAARAGNKEQNPSY
jgi:cob(I)alamin adenosyltransferase